MTLPPVQVDSVKQTAPKAQTHCIWTQPSGEVLDAQSQADSQTTSLPVFSEDISGSDVLKYVLVCLVYCVSLTYVVLNVFLRNEICLYFAWPLGFCYSHSSHDIQETYILHRWGLIVFSINVM